MARVVVIGGGISGLASALFLSRRGHRVTVLEQDTHRPGASLEDDFLPWKRPWAPHAVQPHGFLAPVRDILLQETPDVYAAMLALGAHERSDLRCCARSPEFRPGDERLITIQARRLVLEVSLRRALLKESTAALLVGHPASGLLFTSHRRIPHVVGAQSPRGNHPADLVLDCAGRRSPVPRWLTDAGCRAPSAESSPTGIAYYCRWYRMPQGMARPDDCARTGSFSPFATGSVFPSDSDVFALSFILSASDPTRSTLRDPGTFEAAAHAFPALDMWLTDQAVPLSPVLAMGGLRNTWAPLTDGRGPTATGILRLGDALVHTNPTLGQGAALALRAAVWVAQQLTAVEDPYLLAGSFHRWALQELRPWYETQVSADRATSSRLQQGIEQPALPAYDEQAAIDAFAREDPDTMRARARVRHLMEHSDKAYKDPDLRRKLTHWRRSHPQPENIFEGPTRNTWEEITARPERPSPPHPAGRRPPADPRCRTDLTRACDETRPVHR